MKVSKLPFEILEQIAYNLSSKESLSCALTCKGWRYPFQKALWKNIQVYTYQGVQKFIQSIKASQGVSTSYHLAVDSLHIRPLCYKPDISDIDFSVLFKYLQNVKSLDLGNISYDYIYTNIKRSDKIWKSLESLKIQYGAVSETGPVKNFVEFINTCSMLQELEILQQGPGFLIEFSVDDFDNMHQNLQNLSSIKAGIYLAFDLSAKLSAIPNTAPAFTVTSLDINSKQYKSQTRNWNNWNPLWLYYFGYKYPNLRSLKLEATDTWDNVRYLYQRQSIISLFQSNPKAFQHLEVFDFTTDRYFASSDLVLWELLCALRVPLKHLALDARQSGVFDMSYAMNVDKILQSFSETLESLSLTGFIYTDNEQNISLELSYHCPFLTNLCISGSMVILNLDNLLNKYESLKQLKFCGGQLVTTSNTTTGDSKQQQKQHGLQILTLGVCSIAAEIFNYLSFRCRGMKHMTLNILWVQGFMCGENGCILLDMAHTFLKTLHIGQVRYGASNREYFAEHDIGLTLLSQLNSASLSDKTNEREEKIDPKYPIVARHSIDWLYTYGTFGNIGEYGQKTIKLSKKEADTALEYYQNFQSNTISSTLKEGSSYDEDTPEIGWKYELYKGHAEFIFGNVESIPVVCTPSDGVY
ncbi:hypothetical protein F4703DRAFT_1588105 [Phycomyces blakesleeanus]